MSTFQIQKNDQNPFALLHSIGSDSPVESHQQRHKIRKINKNKDIKIIDEHNNISPNFSKLLLNPEFKRQILEVVDYAIDQYKKEYSKMLICAFIKNILMKMFANY